MQEVVEFLGREIKDLVLENIHDEGWEERVNHLAQAWAAIKNELRREAKDFKDPEDIKPERQGQPWTQKEDNNLLRLWDGGEKKLSKLAGVFFRSENAIKLRLIRYEKLEK